MNILAHILGPLTDAWTRAVQRRNLAESLGTSELGVATVEVARGEIGLGEEGGNNAGPHVARWRGDSKRAAWCASFAGWCLEVAAAMLGVALPFKRSHGAKALYRRIGNAGRFTKLPVVGGVACYERGLDDDWRGHIEVIESVDLVAGTYVTISGNVGAFPARVKRRTHRIDGRGDRLIGFAAV